VSPTPSTRPRACRWCRGRRQGRVGAQQQGATAEGACVARCRCRRRRCHRCSAAVEPRAASTPPSRLAQEPFLRLRPLPQPLLLLLFRSRLSLLLLLVLPSWSRHFWLQLLLPPLRLYPPVGSGWRPSKSSAAPQAAVRKSLHVLTPHEAREIRAAGRAPRLDVPRPVRVLHEPQTVMLPVDPRTVLKAGLQSSHPLGLHDLPPLFL